jgi:hypothetical protein
VVQHSIIEIQETSGSSRAKQSQQIVVKQSQQTTAKISGCARETIKINNQQQQSTATTFQSVSPIFVIPLQQYLHQYSS